MVSTKAPRTGGTGGGMINESMFTSDSTEWITPQHVFDALNRNFNFTLDPCATPENAKCRNYYTKSENGLERSWRGHRVFMNPPYGRFVINKWVKKAYEEAKRGALIVALLPARTDTRWWHDYCESQLYVLIKGRLRFSNAKSGAPFPSVIVVFANIPKSFKQQPQKGGE